MAVRTVGRVGRIEPDAWDRLDHGGSPFLRHGFLAALEQSGSVGGRSGWLPRYLVAEDGERLVGAAPAFVKSHSYGEFIFDWEWAYAARRVGIHYYPKLVLAAPLSPVTGPRLLVDPELGAGARGEVVAALVGQARSVAEEEGCSSVHVLFCTAEEQALLTTLGFAPRASFQYHWHNRGYARFDDYLAQMSSRRRKQIKKERSRARAAIDAIELCPAGALEPAVLVEMDGFYRDNVAAHGGTAYLEPGFFERLAERMPDEVLIARALRDGRAVAGALFVEGRRALYGRYWGAADEIPLLHFELTCYVGIERCIERGTPLYEAGAQGTHKLLRGFEPSPTYSAHLVHDARLDRAVRRYLAEEALAVASQMERLHQLGPFK